MRLHVVRLTSEGGAMADPQGYATFPGVQSVLSASFTLSHGITPSTCQIECLPQRDFPAAGGPLLFTYGGVALLFPDCKVDQQSIRVGDDGQVWQLSIFDRRWKWAFGSLSGTFNFRQEDGTLDTDHTVTPQELCKGCLEAMGEAGYDVSQVPNDTNPEVHWDHDVPARCLADLAETLGCRVVLRLDNTVLVARTGVGAVLPGPADVPTLADALTINPPERPDSLLVVGGPSRYQVDFVLEAVGLDTDGTIWPIAQLSYAPPGGWGNEVPPYFSGISATPTALGKVPQECARNSVYRWYRITLQNQDGSGPPLVVPGYGYVSDRQQVLPLDDAQVQTFLDFDGKKKSLPAWAMGVYQSGDLGFINTPPRTFVTAGLTVDKEHGVVHFDDYLFRLDAANKVQPALLTLRTACNVRDPDRWSPARFEWAYVYPGGSWGTGSRVLKHDELVLEFTPTYDYGNTNQVTSVASNLPDLTDEANYYLAAADLEYQTPFPQDLTYIGLLALSPDGAIQQVSWRVGEDGTTTQAARNSEFDAKVPPYRERRLFEQLKGDQIKQLKGLAGRVALAGGQAP